MSQQQIGGKDEIAHVVNRVQQEKRTWVRSLRSPTCLSWMEQDEQAGGNHELVVS